MAGLLERHYNLSVKFLFVKFLTMTISTLLISYVFFYITFANDRAAEKWGGQF